MPKTFTYLLLSSLCLSHPAFGKDSSSEEKKSPLNVFPLYNSWNRLIAIDLELSFIYMQRNWDRLLNDLPVVFGPNAPPSSKPVVEPQDDPEVPDEPVEYCQECFFPDPCYDLTRIDSNLTLRHTEPKGLGFRHGYSTIEGLFFPFCTDTYRWLFADFRAHYFNNDEWAGNFGLGARFLDRCTTVTYGLNAYYDCRTSHHRKNFYSQCGLGFERLSQWWEWHINGYFAPTHRKKVKSRFFTTADGSTIERRRWEFARSGVDLEIGTYLMRAERYSLYLGAGPYFYEKAKHSSSFYGGRGRLNLNFKRHLIFETIVTYDRQFKLRYQASVALTFPFGGCPKEGPCQEVVSCPVRRNEIILFSHYNQAEEIDPPPQVTVNLDPIEQPSPTFDRLDASELIEKLSTMRTRFDGIVPHLISRINNPEEDPSLFYHTIALPKASVSLGPLDQLPPAFNGVDAPELVKERPATRDWFDGIITPFMTLIK